MASTDQRPVPAHTPPWTPLLLLAIALLWGVQWPIMKFAFQEVGPWTFRGTGAVLGGAVLLALAALARQPLRVARRDVGRMVLVSGFIIMALHLLSGLGVSLMPSGRAVILLFTMPVWASLLSVLVLGERLTAARVVGLLLGLAGMVVLIGPDWRDIGFTHWGPVLMVAASVSWAIGVVLLKRFRWSTPTLSLAAWQLIVGGGPTLLGSLVVEAPLADLAAMSLPVAGAVAYNMLVANSLCIFAWFTAIRLLPAQVAAIGTLLVPVVGVLSSGLLLGEPIGSRELGALGLVVAALVLVLVGPSGLRTVFAAVRRRST